MKGQGSIIIATLFFSILILSAIPLLLHIYYSTPATIHVYENPTYRRFSIAMKEMSKDVRAFLNVSSSELQIANIGGTDIDVEKAVLYISCNDTNYYVDIGAKTLVKSGQTVSLKIQIPSLCQNQRIAALHLISTEGAVISTTVLTPEDLEKLRSQRLNATITIGISSAVQILPIPIEVGDPIWNISSFVKTFDVYTLDSIDRPTRLQSFSDLFTKGMRGGTSTRYIWSLQRVATGTSISISGLTIRNLWIGYDPRNTSRYNLIVTADSVPSGRLTIGSTSVSTSTYTRIKIYGFTPTTSQGVLQLGSRWIRQPSQDVADYTFNSSALTMSGRVDRVEIYTRVTGSDSSYNPYVLFMNTDKSPNTAGILFTTIDRVYGNYNNRNEGVDALIDFSTSPLTLVYKGYTVSNTDSSAVVIAVNYRFHDNEGSDATGTSVDRPIMVVGLVDENGKIYSYRSYTFRELTRYEDTYPPTAQAQSSMIFIPLPPKDAGTKKFSVFVAIQDPYSYSGNLDDLDFTLYIESLSVLPIPR